MRIAAAVLLALLPLASPAAGLYRWVDQNGAVHYTQTPPKAGSFEDVPAAPPPAASPNMQQISKSVRAAESAETKRQQETAKNAAALAQRKELCQRARSRLKFIEDSAPGRLATYDEKGTPRRTTVDEYERERKQMQDIAAEHCAS